MMSHVIVNVPELSGGVIAAGFISSVVVVLLLVLLSAYIGIKCYKNRNQWGVLIFDKFAYTILYFRVQFMQMITEYCKKTFTSTIRKESPLGNSDDSLFEVFGETNEDCSVRYHRETAV